MRTFTFYPMNASAALPCPALDGSILIMSPGSIPWGHTTSMAWPNPLYQAWVVLNHAMRAAADPVDGLLDDLGVEVQQEDDGDRGEDDLEDDPLGRDVGALPEDVAEVTDRVHGHGNHISFQRLRAAVIGSKILGKRDRGEHEHHDDQGPDVVRQRNAVPARQAPEEVMHVVLGVVVHHGVDHAGHVARAGGRQDRLLQDLVRVAVRVEASLLPGQEGLAHDVALAGRDAGDAQLIGDADGAEGVGRQDDRGGVDAVVIARGESDAAGRGVVDERLHGGGGHGVIAVRGDGVGVHVAMEMDRLEILWVLVMQR